MTSAIEMATFSARKERMVQACGAGDRRGTMVRAFQRSPSEYIASLQFLVTSANFIIGAMIGSLIEAPLRNQLAVWLPGSPYIVQFSWGLSLTAITVLSLIFTNVLPKHIGFVKADELALATAPMMHVWIKIVRPFIQLVIKSSSLMAKLLRIAPAQKHRITESDIDVLLLEGTRAGSLDPTEQAVMRNALTLSEVRIGSLMVPIDKVRWIDSRMSSSKIAAFLREGSQSNYPVARGNLSSIVGVLRTQDWFIEQDLSKAMREPVFASHDDSLLHALELLRPAATRLLIVRKGGRVVGVLTLNDVLRHLVGHIRPT